MDEPLLARDGIRIHLPVRIEYHVLEAFLRERMKGEKIKAEKNGEVTAYAEILDFSLEKSQQADHDLDVFVKYRTLTTFFKNKQGEVLVNLSLYFDEAAQELLVTDYKLKGNSEGWLMNKVLPSLINTFLHKKLKDKMRFAFKQKIEEQVNSLNEKLRSQIKAAEGVFVSGELSTARVSDIIVGKSHFLVSVEIEGTGLAEIREIRMNKK